MKDIIPKPKKKIIKKRQVIEAPEPPPENKTQNAVLAVSQISALDTPLASLTAPEAKKQEEKPLKISWQAPEYEYRQKSADWFWMMAIITAALFGASIAFMGNFLFSIFIILAGFVVLLYGARKPRLVSFSITPRGVTIGKRLYPYSDLKSFWLHYDPPRKRELSLRSKKTLMPSIVIPLGQTDPNEVRMILTKFLKEEEQEESMIDAISDHLKF